MMRKLSLYYHTLKHLHWKQLWYRLPVLKKVGRKASTTQLDLQIAGEINNWVPSIDSYPSYKAPHSFRFLNQQKDFSGKVDWDGLEDGLLWTYNLNYFEFLVQKDISTEQAESLMSDFMEAYPSLKIAKDPYPTSLRLIFWNRYFCRQGRKPSEEQLHFIHQQAKELQTKLEYHLLGNHLLENAFALFIASSYLRDDSMYRNSKKLLLEQLKEQILSDGGHYELSPMYHHIMLYRLLDAINICRSSVQDKDVLSVLENYASKMLGWSQAMRFQSGYFPLFNDAANGIAPTPQALTDYAGRLNIQPVYLPLKESGYRKWKSDSWELILDIGQPGPSYQPGHAHCDLLSFELHTFDEPIFVDTGTSVYGGNPGVRMEERSTRAHNTVQVNNGEQSEIWAEFRMARRAKLRVLEDSQDIIEAEVKSFDGSFLHQRRFERHSNEIHILDKVQASDGAIARFHLYPTVNILQKDSNSFQLNQLHIHFSEVEKIEIGTYHYAPEFGKRISAKVLEVHFLNDLCTSIKNA